MRPKVMFFDTTLRDGEQSPGVSLNPREKLEIARQLAAMKVDVIEAGFPVASAGDFEAVSVIARELKGITVCALARTDRDDIETAAQALAGAENPRIHVFISTSPIHMKHMLRMTEEEVLELAVRSVRQARNHSADVEFSAQDATRSDPDFLVRLFTAVIEAGATVVNIPDTVGYTTPEEMAALVRKVRLETPGIDKAVISVHCHDDLGMAVANSLAAVAAGARQVEGTINGIGERAGNAALEEVVMALLTRRDHYGLDVTVQPRAIGGLSRIVSRLTGMPVQPNKAIVGRNAFSHESGIHQDGVLKERQTYEIMSPTDIGLGESTLVLGKHSGRHAFRQKVAELGYAELPEEVLARAFRAFKDLADRKREVSDDDVRALVEDAVYDGVPEAYSLKSFHVSAGNDGQPVATITLSGPEGEVTEAACGDGPIDAVYRAIDRATGHGYTLLEFSLNAVTSGKDALGEASVRISAGDRPFLGRGVSVDIIEASVKAYLNAINKAASAGEGGT